MNIIDLLIEKQGASSDRAFALSLGITPPMWRYLKTGQNKPGARTLAGVAAAYPDLMPAILLHLTENAPIVKKNWSKFRKRNFTGE